MKEKVILLGDNLWSRALSRKYGLPLVAEKLPLLPRFIPTPILDILPEKERVRVPTGKINAAVHLGSYEVPYPIQVLFYQLPQRAKMELLRDYLNAYHGGERKVSNLKEWFLASFGRSMADLFFIPYNEKLWGTPLEKLSCSWAGDLNPRPSPEEIFFGSQGKTENLKTKEVDFSLREGERLLEDTEKHHLHVVEINTERKILKTEGKSYHYEELLSFIPLDRLLDLLKPKERVLELGREFLKKSPRTYLKAEAEECPSRRKVYFPYPAPPFTKFLCFEGGRLVVEIPGEEEIAEEETLSALRLMGFLKGKVRITGRVKSFLPLPTPEVKMMGEALLHNLEERGIFSLGIWGRWEYMGIEKEDRMVKETVSSLIGMES